MRVGRCEGGGRREVIDVRVGRCEECGRGKCEGGGRREVIRRCESREV